jgi:hypothetical protein
MSNTYPLARERFRTILLDPIEAEADRIFEGGVSYADDAVVEALADLFPDAHFEHRTNGAGVRVRRVVVASEWEVDPEPASLAPDGKPWLNPLDENEAESYYDRSSRLTAVREADPDVRD